MSRIGGFWFCNTRGLLFCDAKITKCSYKFGIGLVFLIKCAIDRRNGKEKSW